MSQRVIVAAPGGRTFFLEGATVADLRDALETATGQPLGQQTLCDEQGTPLPSDANLEQEAWKSNKGGGGKDFVLALRVGGRGGAAPIEPSPLAAAAAGGVPRGDGRVLIKVKSRVQLETWSLYWKETMETRTKELPAFEATYDPRTTTVSRVLEDARERLGWEPASELKRLDGFDADWDSAFVRGHRAPLSHTLAAAGLAAGGELVLLRRALEEDGWQVVAEGGGGGGGEGGGEGDAGGGGGEGSSEFDSDDDYTSSEEEDGVESDEDVYA